MLPLSTLLGHERDGKMHSTHFVYCYMVSDIMVKDHSDSKRENPLPLLHGLHYLVSNNVIFTQHPIDRIAHTTAFITPVVEH